MSSIRATNDNEAMLINGKRCEFCDDIKKDKDILKTAGLQDWWRL